MVQNGVREVNNTNMPRPQHRVVRQRKNKKLPYIILQLFIILLVGSLTLSAIILPGTKNLSSLYMGRPNTVPADVYDKGLDKSDYSALVKKITNEISSSNAILIDLEYDEVIAEKSPDAKVFPASITKVMTAIVVLEHFDDVNVMIEMPHDMYAYLIEQNASVAGFVSGEKVKIIDLLYGVLLPSGADACLSLARYVAGTEEAFAKKMTEKAKALGAINTNFTNSTGLHDENHYTTVRDLSIILKYALKNSDFRTIFTTDKYTTSATNKHPYGLTFSSTVFKAFERAGINNVYVKGGKTGYTGEARLCLASLGQKNGREYILVTVGAGTGQSSRGVQHATDANYIYKNFA